MDRDTENDAAVNRWPWILSGLVIIAAVAAFLYARKLETLSQFGGFLSGFAAALAFIWLVAAYQMQGRELRLQRNELALQREAMDRQRQELKKMGRYAALEQVARILDQYDQSLATNAPDRPRSVAELPTAFMGGMQWWKTILEDSDPNRVFEAHTKWMHIDVACEGFLNRFVSAIELYEEASETTILPKGGSSIERLYFAPDAMMNVPFVQHHAGTAKLLATHLFLMQPGRDRLRLKGLEATNSILPGVIKSEALAKLRASVEAHDAAPTKAQQT